MPQYQFGSLKGRGDPPRLQRQRTNSKDNSQSASQSANYATNPSNFSNDTQPYELYSSTSTSPSRQDVSEFYTTGDRAPAAPIIPTFPPPHTSINSSLHSATQQQSQEHNGRLSWPGAMIGRKSEYGVAWTESQSNLPREDRRHSEVGWQNKVPFPSKYQGGRHNLYSSINYVNNTTLINMREDIRMPGTQWSPSPNANSSTEAMPYWRPPAESPQETQVWTSDPQTCDDRSCFNPNELCTEENQSFTARSNEISEKELSTSSSTTTRSHSISSMKSTYTSPASDENVPSNRSFTGSNDSRRSSGSALHSFQQTHITGMLNDVRSDISTLLIQLLMCKVDRILPMESRCLAGEPTWNSNHRTQAPSQCTLRHRLCGVELGCTESSTPAWSVTSQTGTKQEVHCIRWKDPRSDL